MAPSTDASRSLTFLHMMGKLLWFEEPALRDVVITDPIEYLAKPASTVICKLKQSGGNDVTLHWLPVHEKAQKAMRIPFNNLRDKGILDAKLLDILWEDYAASKDELLALMVKFELFVPLSTEGGGGSRRRRSSYSFVSVGPDRVAQEMHLI